MKTRTITLGLVIITFIISTRNSDAHNLYNDSIKNDTNKNTTLYNKPSDLCSSNLSGFIFSETSGKGIEKIKVTAINSDGKESNIFAYSAKDGSYQITNIPKGSITLLFSGGCYFMHQVILIEDEHKIDISFETELTDPRDGNVYKTTQIGDKTWMAENLNYGEMIHGKQNQENNDVPEKYCYDNDEENCKTYGALYQWDEMMRYDTPGNNQGICPYGWHIPTDQEWKSLEGMLDTHHNLSDKEWDKERWRGTDAGTKLKLNDHNYWDNLEYDSSANSGFNALPGGIRIRIGRFMARGEYSLFWTSTEFDNYDAWGHGYKDKYDQAGRRSGDKSFGVAVRCVKDQ